MESYDEIIKLYLNRIKHALSEERVRELLEGLVFESLQLAMVGERSPTDKEITDFFTKEHYHYQKGRYTKVDKDRIYGAKMMRDGKIPTSNKPTQKEGDELPSPFKTLFKCLEDSCYEINFYGNDGNDNQEKIDGKELLIKWVSEAYFDSVKNIKK